MVDIRPNVLPDAILPLRTGDALIVDQGTDGVRQVDPFAMTDSVAPVATQPEAVAGADNIKRMTSLRTKQSIASEVGVTVASNSQGAKADSAVQSVNGKTGNSISLVKADLGLENVDNTSDANKPISSATQTALNLKANSSVTISAGTGLTGGGNLSANRSLALSSASIASLAKADISVQTVNGVAPTGGNVNVLAEELKLQDTIASASAGTYGAGINFVKTSGYSAVGDGGAGLYKLVSSEPTHAGKFQSVDGKWWELSTIEAIPQQFGAVGNFAHGSVSTTAGSPVVTSSTNLFAKARVGDSLCIQVGGGQGLYTIVSKTSSSQINVNSNVAATYTNASAMTGALDTANMQSTLNYASAKSVPIHLTSIYFVDRVTYSGAALTITGTGPQSSGFVLRLSTANFSIASAGSPYNLPYEGTLLKDFSLRSGYDVNSSAGLLTWRSTMSGSPQRYLMLDNINVNTFGPGFDCGISLHNASNYSTRDVQIAGYGPIRSGSVGLRVTGDLKPIDMYNTGLKIYFCDTAVQIRGTASFTTVMEAVVFIGCVLIVNNICIDYQSSTATPYLGVMDSNLNGFKKDIQTLNIVQIKIDNNLFYSADRTPNESNWVGIEVSYNNSAISNACNNTITNNTFSGDNTPNTSRIGVTINSLSPKNVTTLIDGNYFLGMDYGVLTYEGVTGVKITDTNTYDRVTNRALLTTLSGNINGTSNVGITNSSANRNDGSCVRYGRVVTTIASGNRVQVNYPVSMPNATRASAISIATTAYTGVHRVDSFTAGGFSVYFPGSTVGNSIDFTYIAYGD